MRFAMVLVGVVACSPNDAVPDGGHHVDAPVSRDVAAIDARADAVPDTNQPPPPPPPTGILPDVPGPGLFMWPSVQEHFHVNGIPCTGQVTVAVGDRAVCFVGADDDVHCAGAVYTHDWGPTFTAIGVTGVDQIVITPTANSATGNSMCVHKRAGTVWCMGDGNGIGQFGDGTTSPSSTFVQFGSSTTLTRLGMDIDKRCVLDASGNIYCAGYSIGSTPAKQPGTSHVSFWNDSFGNVHIDDPAVFRETNGARCQIESDGVHCNDPSVPVVSGPAGAIVDATVSMPVGGLAMGSQYVCWLEPNGAASCQINGSVQAAFAGAPPLVAIAGNFYADARCAVASDASLWCIGTNMHGELGTGTTSPVTVETRVAPPGTVKLTCH